MENLPPAVENKAALAPSASGPASPAPSTAAPQSTSPTVRRRPRAKWIVFAAAGLMCAGVLGASLRERPRIDTRMPRTTIDRDDAFQLTVRTVNEQTEERIRAAGLEAASEAEPLAVCRRLSLALVGTTMSLEEIRALEEVPDDEKVRWWTAHLLNDRRWADYFAERIARACVGTNQGPFLLFRRRKFNAWLADKIESGVGYDQIVRDMIGSDGLWTDTPAVNFITATMDEARNGRADPVRLAGRTSRAFLAMRIDCLQCHDDVLQKTNFGTLDKPIEGTQKDFHGLAAFYGGTRVAEAPFRGIVEDKQAYEFQYLGADKADVVEPQVPFRPELLPADGKPRRRLAQWLTHPDNKQFARAAVNRVWALMFGTGLVEPVDDIPLVGDVPEMLDTLADDFVKHNYNLRRLVTLIAATEAFQRSSRADFDVTPAHEAAWAVYPLVQLRPDQIAGSIVQACRLTAVDDRASIFMQLKAFGDSNEFVKRFGDRGEDEFNFDAVTITQRLLMMNGNMVEERTKYDLVGNASTQIATLVKDDDETVRLVFLSTLNRYPSAEECETFKSYLNGKRGGPRVQAVSDMTWAMLNSTEFSWSH